LPSVEFGLLEEKVVFAQHLDEPQIPLDFVLLDRDVVVAILVELPRVPRVL
jgi:hypothetical protein